MVRIQSFQCTIAQITKMSITKKIKIAFVMPHLSVGGAESVVKNFIQNLNREKFDITLILISELSDDQAIDFQNVNILECKQDKLRNAIPGLVQFLRKSNPDIIFSSLAYLNLLLIFLSLTRAIKGRVVVREANMPNKNIKNSQYPVLFKCLYKMLYRHAQLVIASSQTMQDEFIKFFDHPTAKITVINNPVDELAIRDQSLSLEMIDTKTRYIVAAGRLTHQKGYDILLEWFASTKLKSYQLIVLGDGPLKHDLINQVNSLKIQHLVKFQGYQKNPWSWYASADIFMLASRWEGMPNAVLESLACGTPVIISKEAGGIADLSRLCEPGAVSIFNDPSEIDSIIDSLELNKTQSPKNSLLPREYSIASSIESLEEIFQDIAYL